MKVVPVVVGNATIEGTPSNGSTLKTGTLTRAWVHSLRQASARRAPSSATVK